MKYRTKLLLALTLLIAAGYYWFLIDGRAEAVTPRSIDIVRLRQQAQAMPGAKPVRIEFIASAMRRVPGTLLVAGGGLAPNLVGDVAYRLVTPDGDTVIDSGQTARQAKAGGYRLYLAAAQTRIDQWLQGARRVVFTHEHPGHIGGFAGSPELATIAAKAMLTPEERAEMVAMRPDAASLLPAPLAATDYVPVAPGVVMFDTPGHTPGSRMLFVQLQDGREYLFAGDTVAMARNLSWMRPRSRLLGGWRRQGEDRAAVMGWLRGVEDLHRREPGVTIVYGHDLDWLMSPKFGPGFAAAFDITAMRENGVGDDGNVEE